ncbi:Transient receptor protein [Penaeus vannamei]|uniref:Transient receptor protein n=1 Tax=Penaeus vannamei TaxID=6689 RepID=A0A3R7T1L5_PENVA|nr:Transient receptor protein [Penaeus vannamei]
MVERLHKQGESRGGYPSITELLIVVYVFGFHLREMKALWNDGLLEYAKTCLNNLLWYYDIDKGKCYSLPGGLPNPKESQSCEIWRRFSNLFETSQSLFWASFGLVDLINFELTGIKSFTRFWSMLMFGSYNVINVIVLLNLLIAMMSNSTRSLW